MEPAQTDTPARSDERDERRKKAIIVGIVLLALLILLAFLLWPRGGPSVVAADSADARALLDGADTVITYTLAPSADPKLLDVTVEVNGTGELTLREAPTVEWRDETGRLGPASRDKTRSWTTEMPARISYTVDPAAALSSADVTPSRGWTGGFVVRGQDALLVSASGSTATRVVLAPSATGWALFAPYPQLDGAFVAPGAPKGYYFAGPLTSAQKQIGTTAVTVAWPTSDARGANDSEKTFDLLEGLIPIYEREYDHKLPRLMIALVGEPFARSGLAGEMSLWAGMEEYVTNLTYATPRSLIGHELTHVYERFEPSTDASWFREGDAEATHAAALEESGVYGESMHARFLRVYPANEELRLTGSIQGRITSLYDKATAVTVALDASLREATNGAKTMRDLRLALGNESGFDTDRVRKAAVEVGGASMGDTFDELLTGDAPVAYLQLEIGGKRFSADRNLALPGPSGSQTIRVLRGDEPVEGARVEVEGGASGTTDASGSVVLDVGTGQKHIRATKAPWAKASAWIDAGGQGTKPTETFSIETRSRDGGQAQKSTFGGSESIGLYYRGQIDKSHVQWRVADEDGLIAFETDRFSAQTGLVEATQPVRPDEVWPGVWTVDLWVDDIYRGSTTFTVTG